MVPKYFSEISKYKPIHICAWVKNHRLFKKPFQKFNFNLHFTTLPPATEVDNHKNLQNKQEICKFNKSTQIKCNHSKILWKEHKTPKWFVYTNFYVIKQFDWMWSLISTYRHLHTHTQLYCTVWVWVLNSEVSK